MNQTPCQGRSGANEERLMNRPLKACLAGLALAFAASPALADGWRSTPWPNVSEGGNRFCFVSYHAAPRLFSVTAMADGALLSIVDPAFNGAERSEERRVGKSVHIGRRRVGTSKEGSVEH